MPRGGTPGRPSSSIDVVGCLACFAPRSLATATTDLSQANKAHFADSFGTQLIIIAAVMLCHMIAAAGGFLLFHRTRWVGEHAPLPYVENVVAGKRLLLKIGVAKSLGGGDARALGRGNNSKGKEKDRGLGEE